MAITRVRPRCWQRAAASSQCMKPSGSRHRRAASTASVEGDDSVAIAKRFDLPVPHAVVEREPVKKKEHRSLAARLVVEASSVDLRRSGFDRARHVFYAEDRRIYGVVTLTSSNSAAIPETAKPTPPLVTWQSFAVAVAVSPAGPVTVASSEDPKTLSLTVYHLSEAIGICVVLSITLTALLRFVPLLSSLARMPKFAVGAKRGAVEIVRILEPRADAGEVRRAAAADRWASPWLR